MKRVHALRAALSLTVPVLLLAGLFTASPTGSAQYPEPTPAPGTFDESRTPDAAEPEPGPVTQETPLDLGGTLGGSPCTNPPANWVIKEPLGTPANGAAVASDGNYVYVAGGEDGSTALDLLQRYDPATNRWTTLSPLPTAVRNALAVCAGGKLYVMGGDGGGAILSSLQIYNIGTGVWSSGAAMPGIRQQMGGAYYNGKIYVVGGYNSTAVSPQDQTWEYTIATDSWSVKASLPSPLGGPGSGVVGSWLYILGGRDGTHSALNTAYRYLIPGNYWTNAANLLEPVNRPGSAVYNRSIWLFGGGAPYVGAGTAQVYDQESNIWEYGPAQNVARSYQGGAVVRNRLISVGGYDGAGDSAVVEALSQERLKILIIYADWGVLPNGLRFDLLRQHGVGQVDVFNGQAGTPTLDQLQNYDVVVPFSNEHFASATGLGDVLADYQDAGGTVVAFAFDWYSSWAIGGRWVSGGYSPFNSSSTPRFQTATLGPATNHPLMDGVTYLSAHYRLELTPAASASLTAYWDDGLPLIFFKGRAVGVNAYIGDYADNWSGDFARVIVNAGNWLWLGNRSCDHLVCTHPTVIHGAISDTDATQTGRIVRLDPPSTCELPQACAINDTTYVRHYDAHVFANNDIQEQCVTVTVDPGTCIAGVHLIHSAVYLGVYNPGALCANFLADIGGSPTQIKSYSFTVPPWQTYTVVVNEVDPNTYCSGYELTVSADDCGIKNAHVPLCLRRYQ